VEIRSPSVHTLGLCLAIRKLALKYTQLHAVVFIEITGMGVTSRKLCHVTHAGCGAAGADWPALPIYWAGAVSTLDSRQGMSVPGSFYAMTLVWLLVREREETELRAFWPGNWLARVAPCTVSFKVFHL